MYTISFLEQSSMSGYHRAPKGNFEEERLLNLDRSINRYRWLLLIFNVLAIMVALATFCVCIWIRLVYNLCYCKMVTKVIFDWYFEGNKVLLKQWNLFCISRFDLDFREWVVEIDWYSYWHAMYAVMLSMVCVAIVSIIGIFGVVEVVNNMIKIHTRLFPL